MSKHYDHTEKFAEPLLEAQHHLNEAMRHIHCASECEEAKGEHRRMLVYWAKQAQGVMSAVAMIQAAEGVRSTQDIVIPDPQIPTEETILEFDDVAFEEELASSGSKGGSVEEDTMMQRIIRRAVRDMPGYEVDESR